jgi:hypothetical protein
MKKARAYLLPHRLPASGATEAAETKKSKPPAESSWKQLVYRALDIAFGLRVHRLNGSSVKG